MPTETGVAHPPNVAGRIGGGFDVIGVEGLAEEQLTGEQGDPTPGNPNVTLS